MSELPPPEVPSTTDPKAAQAPWYRRRFLKAPVWLWISAVIVIAGVASSGDEETSSIQDGGPLAAGDTREPEAVTTTTIYYRYEPSDDPIENLLWIANSETYSLPGWALLGRTSTDDDMVFDDIRINVADDVDYKSRDDAQALIDVALAIIERSMSPVQIDIRVEVEHSEMQPDGSIEYDTRRREWIEVTGDKDGYSFTVDVYGFEPEETARMQSLKSELQTIYPELLVKATDTSTFDD